ncbi:hypothetical protein ACVW07_002328 [Cellulomonas sp. URHB0016]
MAANPFGDTLPAHRERERDGAAPRARTERQQCRRARPASERGD